MSEAIKLSVALVTRNRPDSLARCLASLCAQDEQPFEIVVSDDSDDPLAGSEISRRFGARHVAGPRRGLYANRNAAALACSGSHVRTMDDDHTFPPGHLRRCLDSVASDPAAIWTTGETCIIDGRSHGFAKTAAQLHPSGLGGPVEDLDNNWAISDGSTIYPSQIFACGARMIEDFSYGPAYLEFGAYLYHLGFRSRCIPDAPVEHHATRATLLRGGRDLAGGAAWLIASLSYNLHFRPSLANATRYTLAVLLASSVPFRLLLALPGLVARVRDRWKASAS